MINVLFIHLKNTSCLQNAIGDLKEIELIYELILLGMKEVRIE